MKAITKKALIAGLILLISSVSVFANALENKNAIGMYIIGGDPSYGGIQYERRFSDLISVKFGTFALYQTYSYSNTSEAQFNFIIEPDFTLYQTDWNDKVSSRLFAFGLAGYDFKKKVNVRWDFSGGVDGVRLDDEVTYINSAVAAVGFGFDFIFFGHLSVPIQFGFMGTINEEDPNVGFCGGLGLRYAW